MASTGFLADLSRRPAGVKIGLLVVVLALLAGAWYALFYKKLDDDLKAETTRANSFNGQEKKLSDDEARYKELDEQQKKLKQLIEDNDSALPTAAQLPAFFEMLNRKVSESGVEVHSWDYQKEAPVDEGGIYKVPVSIEIEGTFYQLEKFFYLLYKVNQKEGDDAATPAPVDTQERDRILTIEDLHISDPVLKNNELVLTCSFRASTFRKEEAVVPAEPAKNDKKPAAGGGAPGKAKAKTDDAMKKDEARTEGANAVKEGM